MSCHLCDFYQWQSLSRQNKLPKNDYNKLISYKYKLKKKLKFIPKDHIDTSKEHFRQRPNQRLATKHQKDEHLFKKNKKLNEKSQ